MKMFSKLGLVLVVPHWPHLAMAATDYSGIYNSDAPKSSWSNGEFPKNFSLMIEVKFEGDKLVYHSVNAHSSSREPRLYGADGRDRRSHGRECAFQSDSRHENRA